VIAVASDCAGRAWIPATSWAILICMPVITRLPELSLRVALCTCSAALVLGSGCGDDDEVELTPLDAGWDAGPDTTPRMQCSPTGQSVTCVGPGGCDGAQVCRADGSYGDCDCGDQPAIGCAPAGIVVTCAGEGGCAGHQVCGERGAFSACECPDAAAGAITALEITSPEAGAIVSGTLEMTGTAAGSIATVGVAIGDGPLLLAEGTRSWSLTYDVADLRDQTVTITVVAIGEDGSQLQRWRQVKVRNVDPLVGTWFRTQPAFQPGQAWSYCVVTFLENGALDSSACVYSTLGYSQNTWQRTSRDLVEIRGDGSSTHVLKVATVSADGETLEVSSSGNTRETFIRVHGDPPSSDPDAGTEDDAGSN
jgi:hypothetical protein